jgi:ABC-2 type transport system permease protein
MKKIIDIAFKDMTQNFRSMIALVMMFAVPILLVGMFYIMFGGDNSEEEPFEIPVTKVIIVNRDVGIIQFGEAFPGRTPVSLAEDFNRNGMASMGSYLTEMLLAEGYADLMSIKVMEDANEAKNAVDRQDAGVAILIPENFTDSLSASGGQSLVEFYQDPGLSIGPNVVKGVVQQILDEFNSSQFTLQITFEQMIKNGISIDTVSTQVIMDSYFQEMRYQQQGQNQASLMNVLGSEGEQVDLIGSVGLVSMMMTGMTVFYVFFTGASTAQSLLTEEQKGTLSRLFTTPTDHSVILGGKFISGVMMIIVQITVLMLFGNLVFKIDWGHFITLLPVILSLTLAAASFGIFLMSWVRTERQAGLLIGGFVTIMGMLGMLPIFVFSMPNPPEIVFSLSHIVPQGWAVEGLQIAMEGGAPPDVMLNAIVLIVWAVFFFLFGVLRFRRRFA